MDLRTLQQTKTSIVTPCCRKMHFSTRSSFVYAEDSQNIDFPNKFSFSIDSVSVDPVILYLSIKPCVGKSLNLPIILPRY